MLAEHFLITMVFCAAIFPLLATWGRVFIPYRASVIGMLTLWIGFPLAIIITSYANRTPRAAVEQPTSRPITVNSDGYVGSDSCRSCHPHHHATWQASYHRTMTQVATPTSIIPAVANARFETDGMASHLSWQGDTLWASIDMPRDTGKIEAFQAPIVMTTGSHHMQILWFSIRNNTRLLGMFPYVYLKDQDKWIPRGAAFLQPSFGMGDEVGRWNQTCIACHTTHGRTRPARKVTPDTGQLYLDPYDPDSQAAAFGISCEACHGPGEAHIRATHNPVHRYRAHMSRAGDPYIVNPLSLSHKRKSQVCGQCHSVQQITATDEWWEHGFRYRPGDDLDESPLRFVVQVDPQNPDARLQQVLADNPAFVEDHFWSDGTVRISGREYNGLIESPCYRRGELSCLSCHQMHQDEIDDRDVKEWANDQLHLGMAGNQACTQCHQEFQNEQTLTQHTHHEAQSPGSNCYNCHMSYTTYGLLKAIRSHRIEPPNVAISLGTGRPNACNQCHLDKTIAWTSEQLLNWYGLESPSLSPDEQSIAASILWLLRGDAGQRALMAWSYGWSDARNVSGTDWMAPYLTQLLDDPYAAVRFIAERSLRKLDRYQNINYDFLGPSDHRQATRQKVLAVWNDTHPPPNDALLISADGMLDSGTLERLLRARNDRPITLAE